MSSKTKDTKTLILTTTWKLMEESEGHGISMAQVAEMAGISRQAVYLHFKSRTELMVATVSYVDDFLGLNERLKNLANLKSGLEFLDASIEIWGNHIPEIYGIAKNLLNTKSLDEASASAWSNRMSSLFDYCKKIIEIFKSEKILSNKWTANEAAEILWTLLSIQNWESLTKDRGWTTEEYISRMKVLVRQTLLYRGI